MLQRIINHFQPRWLLIAGTAYVVLLLLSHWQLPEAHVWAIAGVFSVIMNVPYVATAWRSAQFARLETAVATILIAASVVGAVITPAFVHRLRDAKLGFHCWTVNEPELARHFAELGVDSITTDYPAKIRAALEAGAAVP